MSQKSKSAERLASEKDAALCSIVKLFIVSAMCLILTSCSLPQIFSSADSQSSYVLSERQVKILEQEKMPTKYEELSLKQRINIEAIEDLLKHLDEQYPEETFTFVGYIPQSSLEYEQLQVLSQYGEVTVTRKIGENGVSYEDDFICVKASDNYEAKLNGHLAKSFTETDYIVDVTVNEFVGTYDGKSPGISNCIAAVTVFVKESVGKSAFQEIASSAMEFLKSTTSDSNVGVDFYLVKDSGFSLDLPEQYKKDNHMDIFVNHINHNIREHVK